MALITARILCAFVVTANVLSWPVVSTDKIKRRLVVLLIDAMRWDYLDRMQPQDLGGFRHFTEDGVRAKYVQPLFPSVAYPTWMTMQTGRYPDSHNVLDGEMYDRKTGYLYKQTIGNPMWQQHAVPIWLTAARCGLSVAESHWHNGEMPFYGSPVPIKFLPKPGNFEERMDVVIKTLKDGFDLILVYTGILDTVAGQTGPNSEEVMQTLRTIGVGLEKLFAYIKNEERENGVHVMLLSGFGMAPCTSSSIDFSKYINVNSDIEQIIERYITPMAQIFVKPGRESAVYEKLQQVPLYTTYLKKDIPAEFHYKGGVYAPDILMIPEPPSGIPSQGPNIRGCSTFDPALVPDLRPTFLGWGDEFVGGGLVAPPLRTVDIYQLFGYILDLPLQPHNGSRAAVYSMLR